MRYVIDAWDLPETIHMNGQSLKTEKIGTVTVVQLGPEYDNITEIALPKLQTFVLDIAEKVTPPHLVLNLQNVVFFGTGFIEVMFRTWQRINRRDGRFGLCSMQKYPKEVLKVAKLDTVWRVFPDVESAVNEWRTAAAQ